MEDTDDKVEFPCSYCGSAQHSRQAHGFYPFSGIKTVPEKYRNVKFEESLRKTETLGQNVTSFDREHISDIMRDKPGFDWFTCKMLRLLASCDLQNREKIRTIYPDIVALFEEWRNG